LSSKTNVRLILELLQQAGDVIALAYEKGRVEQTEENRKLIVRLNQHRILTPDIHDTYQLRYSMRQFLNTVLHTGRLMEAGTDFGLNFKRLDELVTRHNDAFLSGREDDRERLDEEIRESINDIAGGIEDELLHVSSLVDSKFATVTTMAEKVKENEWYLKRTESLLSLLENFHFSDIEQRLLGYQDLELAFELLLKSRMPGFLNTLKFIYARLNEFMFEFRHIEERARLVRNLWSHLNRNPDWEPKAWDEEDEPQEWLLVAKPVLITFHPDVNSSSDEEELVDMAEKLPEFTVPFNSGKRRPRGVLIDSEPPVIYVSHTPLQKAIKSYFGEAVTSEHGISAHEWWLANPAMLDGIPEDIWMLRVLSERQNKMRDVRWKADLETWPVTDFDGNIQVRDIFVSKRRVTHV
jgi:hypothetical protein